MWGHGLWLPHPISLCPLYHLRIYLRSMNHLSRLELRSLTSSMSLSAFALLMPSPLNTRGQVANRPISIESQLYSRYCIAAPLHLSMPSIVSWSSILVRMKSALFHPPMCNSTPLTTPLTCLSFELTTFARTFILGLCKSQLSCYLWFDEISASVMCLFAATSINVSDFQVQSLLTLLSNKVNIRSRSETFSTNYSQIHETLSQVR